MHLSTDRLLEVRDGTGSPAEIAHAGTCPICAAEKDRLGAVADQLRALPALAPTVDAWPVIRAAADGSRDRRRRVWAALAAAALLAVCSAVGLFRLSAAKPTDEAELNRLMARSRQLEMVLQRVGDDVMSGHEANTVADLEERLARVDGRLGTGRSVRPVVSVALWHERVELLDALINVKASRASYAAL